MGSIGTRLREERDRLGFNQTDFAAIAGQAKKSQTRYEADDRSPDGDYFAKIAAAGADIAYILTGNRGSAMSCENASAGPLIAPLGQDGDFVRVPLHDALLAAGPGSVNDDEAIIDHLAFRRDWLRKIKTAPAQAVLARAIGDSMQPTIWAGDIVMIDRAKNEIPVRPHAAHHRQRLPIYALLDDGEARLKRVERPEPGQVMLLSDNPDYPPQLAKIETLQIIGKVVWWGHTVRD